MLRPLGLKWKLLISMFCSALLLIIILSSITLVALNYIQDQANIKAADSLKAKSQDYLQQLLQKSATLTRERLAQVSAVGTIAAKALVAANQQEMVNPAYVRNLRRIDLKSGGTTYEGPANKFTSVYLPPQVSSSEGVITRDLRLSAVLNTMLPELQNNVRNIEAIVYVGPSGLLRFYPPVNFSETVLEFERELMNLEKARQENTGPFWLEPFKNLEFQRYGSSFTGVVTPIYEENNFLGIIITYISLAQITNDISRLTPVKDSFTFLIDEQKTLIAAPAQALFYLLGKPQQALMEPEKIDKTVDPQLDAIIESMALGGAATQQIVVPIPEEQANQDNVTLRKQSFSIAYEPITTADWSLGLMAPIDELTREAEEVRSVIEETRQTARDASLISALLFLILTVLASLYLSHRLTRPLVRLAQATEALGRGDYDQRVEIETQDEFGQVANAFNTMSQSLRRAREDLETQNRLLEETVQARTTDLRNTVDQLEDALAQQEALYDLLRAVSTPVIPVARGVLLLPLIGTLDEERAHQAIQIMLESVEATRAHTVILDVTGLPMVDTAVAATLVRAAQAARLLGAHSLLAGIRPEVAETLVTLGVGLDQLQTVADLQVAIAIALQSNTGSTVAYKGTTHQSSENGSSS